MTFIFLLLGGALGMAIIGVIYEFLNDLLNCMILDKKQHGESYRRILFMKWGLALLYGVLFICVGLTLSYYAIVLVGL